jgi:hypothetical protein
MRGPQPITCLYDRTERSPGPGNAARRCQRVTSAEAAFYNEPLSKPRLCFVCPVGPISTHATNTLPAAVLGECGLDVAFECEVFQITEPGRGLNSRPVSGFSAADPDKRVEDMFHRALRAISPILDGVFGLPEITILALLACIGMGLAIARIDIPNAPLREAATSTAGQSRDWEDYDQRYLLVAGFPTARIRPQDLEILAFGFGHLSRSTVPFSWGRKWRNLSAGERFRRN